MRNDEKMIAERLVSFVVRASSLIRHSTFVLRHFRGAFFALTWLVTSSDAFAESTPAHSEHTNRLAQEKSPYLLQHAHAKKHSARRVAKTNRSFCRSAIPPATGAM